MNEVKKLKKIVLNQESIIDRISQGKMKWLLGGYGTLGDECLLAGCGSNCNPPQTSGCPQIA